MFGVGRSVGLLVFSDNVEGLFVLDLTASSGDV